MNFWGYKRPDGKVGIRNHVLILPASICASDTTRIIASQVEGAITFNNQNGCSQVPPDMKLTMDVLAGYAANPNIYGTVVVSLGCEGCQLVVFTTGLGTPTGNAVAPVMKITANKKTYKTMKDNLDFDASHVIYGPETMEEIADQFMRDVIDICNGRLVKAEALGYIETAISRACNYM